MFFSCHYVLPGIYAGCSLVVTMFYLYMCRVFFSCHYVLPVIYAGCSLVVTMFYGKELEIFMIISWKHVGLLYFILLECRLFILNNLLRILAVCLTWHF